ncbi:LysM peptidoglycan-binding domain-containing protein [Flavobacterium chuncheonense]|uniref:LysM peptidoglycan-binding domain-containing protein n=1 Tax=Flavobacterium chuncheonense TaxID=2026653 RepID=A0ABW5YPG9_9FLAO
MKLIKVVFFVMLFSTCVAQTTQEPYTKHKVQKGETVYQIAKKYNVTPFDIYRLNPDAKESISENTTLLIPKASSKVATKTTSASGTTIHKVAPKETLFSLAKKYQVSITDLKEWNPELVTNGLQIGQELVVSKTFVPKNNDLVNKTTVTSTTSTFSHVVKTQETVYGISKKYNISITDLEKLNPQLKESGLNVGDVLTIKTENKVALTSVNDTENLYTVKPKETIFSLSKQFNVTPNELITLNPELSNGLKDGMQLKLPSKVVLSDTILKVKPLVRLIDSVDFNTRKELVMLLPFNMAKMDADSSKTYKEFVKDDKLLNLTLDYYSGALMAIDSAKVLGLPVTVKIVNVESSRNSSNVAKILSSQNFSSVNAVIGPFYNSHVESAAKYLAPYNVPVISPLSKEKSQPLPNLYNAIPTDKRLYTALFDYMNAKNGNIVAVISQKKKSSKDFLQSHFTNVKYPVYNEKGDVTMEAIQSQLVKERLNFVILDSEKARQVMNVTNYLMKLKEEFNIQLVVLELYDTLDYEEIPIANLMELKMLFPSTHNDVETPSSLLFEKEYRKKYGAAPNSKVIAGFDTTFDTLLRICQKDGYSTSVAKYRTEYVESAFNYDIDNGVNVNTAVYLQYYDKDYSIKKAL